MKIEYSPTRTITTIDLFMACDPPIEFESRVRLTPEWARQHRLWEEAGSKDVEMALELVGQAFVSVSQGGESYPLETKEAVQELRDAIDAQNEGAGNEFICDILDSFAFSHYNYLASRSMAYAALSGQSNGSGEKKNPVAVS